MKQIKALQNEDKPSLQMDSMGKVCDNGALVIENESSSFSRILSKFAFANEDIMRRFVQA